jgi:RNA polymerase sigma-70 factor (ECF subfamily)
VTESEFRDSFREYKDVVYRFAYRMMGSSAAAEDVAQECFVALWKKPGGFDPARGAMRGYLLGIARNQVLKQWKQQSRYELEEAEAVVAPVDLVGLERAEAIAAAVQALPALQREALVLAEYEELSLDEIATITGADLAAVKSRLHRARQNLRKTLAPLLEKKGSFHGTGK